MNSTEYYRKNPDAAARKVAYQKKVNARPEEKKRRAALNKERRRRGIDGKGGPDVSHTVSGKTVLEDPHTNRGRQGSGGKPRLKQDSVWADGFRDDVFGPSKGNGKKCGNSFIPKSQKCRKGMGGPNSPERNGGEAGLKNLKGPYANFLKSKGVSDPSKLGVNSKKSLKLTEQYMKTKAGKAEAARDRVKYQAYKKKKKENYRKALLGSAAVGAALGVGLEVFKRRR